MSEFSESLQLRSTDMADGVALLRAAKVAGFVFPANERWVAVVYAEPQLGSRTALDSILAVNRGLLLHYSFAADHGCSVDAYEGAQRTKLLRVSFEGGKKRFASDDLIRLLQIDAENVARIQRWVETLFAAPRDARYVVAQAIGLDHYRWLSYAYVDADDTPELECLRVDATGRVTPHGAANENELEELLSTLPPTKKGPRRAAAVRDDAEARDLLDALADVTKLLDDRTGKPPK